MKENWESDVDIYIPLSSYNIFSNFLRKTRDVGSCVKIDSDVAYSTFEEIKYVQTYSINKNKVQIIVIDVSPNNLFEFIIRTFDFDIIKNVFFQNKISICNYEEIFSKIVNFKIGSAPLTNAIKRARKYEKRGFTFKRNVKYTNLFKLYYSAPKIKVIESREITDTDILCKCSDKCIIKFFYPGQKHQHVKYFLKHKHGDKMSQTYIKSIILDISLNIQIPAFPKEKILAKDPHGGYYNPSYHKLKDIPYLSYNHIPVLN